MVLLLEIVGEINGEIDTLYINIRIGILIGKSGPKIDIDNDIDLQYKNKCCILM